MLVSAYLWVYQRSYWWGRVYYHNWTLSHIHCIMMGFKKLWEHYFSSSGFYFRQLNCSVNDFSHSCIEYNAVWGGLLYWRLEALEATDYKLEESETVPLFYIVVLWLSVKHKGKHTAHLFEGMWIHHTGPSVLGSCCWFVFPCNVGYK